MNEKALLETLQNSREDGKLAVTDRGIGLMDSTGHRVHTHIEANRDLSLVNRF